MLSLLFLYFQLSESHTFSVFTDFMPFDFVSPILNLWGMFQ